MAKQQIYNYSFTPGYNQTYNAYPNAVTRLSNNKRYIQVMATAYIAYQVANNVSPFINFTYNSFKCERDVGYVIDAYINDLRFGGNVETVQMGSFYWSNGIPQIDGDRSPEISTHNYIRDLINNYIFTGTAASPAYQTIVTQNASGSAAEAGASTVITGLAGNLTSYINTGTSPSITTASGSYGYVYIDGNINYKDLLLITNVTKSTIVYNFADSTKAGYSIYQFPTQQTRYALYTDTTGMSSQDKLQIFVNKDTEFVKPHPTYQDPVEKQRVSEPQAMIDTDFEYSLQGTKWETVSLVNNIPSVYSKANEPSFTASQITSILPVPGGASAAISTITYAANGTTGLTLILNYGASYADDANYPISLPFTVPFLGVNYSTVYLGSNGYITFGGGSNAYSGLTGANPPFPSLMIMPGDRTMYQYYTGTVGSTFIIRAEGNNCCATGVTYIYEVWFTSGSNTIKVHIPTAGSTYGVNAPAVGDGVNSTFVAQNSSFPVSNSAYQIITSAGASRDVTVTVNTTPSTAFYIGQPIILKETASLYLDGSYLIKSVPSSLSFVATMSVSLVSGTNYVSNYTTIYTGGFFTSAEIPLTSITTVVGTTDLQITFSTYHGLFPGQYIYVVDASQSAQVYIGSFSVKNILSSTVVTYTGNALSNYGSATTVSTGTTKIYVRPTGIGFHRFQSGGVQINPGSSTPNCQIIRQTRKYFRYQSGKGIQFSTGILFAPTYDVATYVVLTNVYNASSYPYFDLNITTDQVNGFAQPDTYRVGAYILLSGFTVSTGLNYNGLYYVQSITNDKTFTIKVSPSITDLFPGGQQKITLVSWTDAVVRDGLYDDQNGIFFEHDGTDLAVVKRSSTLILSGTAAVTNNSATVTGTNTKWATQLAAGNYVVIKGCSYLVTNIFSNTSLAVQPDYRGNTETGLKIQKTVDTRVIQSNFNLDKIDGTGPSGFVFDRTKMQMVFLDYSWYGAGRIRWGMRSLDGSIIYIHQAPQNNINTEAYMRSGNLPGRFEINTKSKLGVLTSSLSTSGTSFTMLTTDADQFVKKGRAIINSEVIRYTKGTISGANTNFTIDLRNEYGLSSNASASVGDSVQSFNQNCAPALSHWGVSAIMDGRFDEDKSYLFTSQMTNNITIGSGSTVPLISIRLAPTVDNGIGREFGIRNLINRSAITLKSVGIVTSYALSISIKINSESTLFTTTSNWVSVGNGSISQYLDHSVKGTTPAPTAGDNMYSFYADDGNGRAAITNQDISIIRDLGNSILGGNNGYPDGPDLLVVFATNLSVNTATVKARISWTEAQG